MSDILIKGMEMPKSCWHCEFCRDGLDEYAQHYNYCVALDMNILISQTERHENCPLVEVPTPHGRLIDADTLKDKMLEYFGDSTRLCEEIRALFCTAPTIIESENG